MTDMTRKMDVMRCTTFYFTPFAIFLVVFGLVFGGATTGNTTIVLWLLAFTVSFNLGSFVYVLKQPEQITWVQKIRLGFNYAFNIAFVFLMVSYWPPIWLLFLLTVIVVGLFEDQKTMLTNAGSLSIMLLFIYYHYGLLQEQSLGFVLINIVSMFFIGLFINTVKNKLFRQVSP